MLFYALFNWDLNCKFDAYQLAKQIPAYTCQIS